MTEDLLAMSTCTRAGGNVRLGLPVTVDERLGQPETIAWFHDSETGLIYIVPQSEVALR